MSYRYVDIIDVLGRKRARTAINRLRVRGSVKRRVDKVGAGEGRSNYLGLEREQLSLGHSSPWFYRVRCQLLHTPLPAISWSRSARRMPLTRFSKTPVLCATCLGPERSMSPKPFPPWEEPPNQWYLPGWEGSGSRALWGQARAPFRFSSQNWFHPRERPNSGPGSMGDHS